MKKTLFTVILIFFIAAASFGGDIKLSAGGGINFQGVYGMGYRYPSLHEEGGTINNNQFGLFLFFDATYAEVDFAFNYGVYTWDYYAGYYDYSGTEQEFTGEISLMGKYPFYLEQFTLFPLLGISGKWYFWGSHGAHEAGVNTTASAINTGSLGFLAGVGGDFNLTEHLYLRGELLYVIKLRWINDEKQFDTERPGNGVKLKLGVGYSF